jgi:hypothetical protein
MSKGIITSGGELNDGELVEAVVGTLYRNASQCRMHIQCRGAPRCESQIQLYYAPPVYCIDLKVKSIQISKKDFRRLPMTTKQCS